MNSQQEMTVIDGRSYENSYRENKNVDGGDDSDLAEQDDQRHHDHGDEADEPDHLTTSIIGRTPV